MTVVLHNPLPPDYDVGDLVPMVFSGNTPIGPGVNGLYNCTITAQNTITYPLTTSPGTISFAVGTVQFFHTIELQQMATSFFGQGN